MLVELEKYSKVGKVREHYKMWEYPDISRGQAVEAVPQKLTRSCPIQ